MQLNVLNIMFKIVARSGSETKEKEAADRASKEGQGGADSKAKKVWREHENRWSHDRYNEVEQAPKSREELIAVYGYDIRNEEGPPRARRRRRYG
jgi:protein CASC3